MQKLISPSLLKSLLLAGLSAGLLQGCGAKSTTTDASGSTETATTTTATTTKEKTAAEKAAETATESNALALAYPGTLALSVLPSSTGASLRLADEEVDPGKHTYTEKLEATEKRLKGEGDCFAAGEIAERTSKDAGIKCYEFDSDMNPSRFNAGDTTRDFGTTDGTDGKGQSCLVSFAKSQVDDITNKVDRALAMVQGVICMAKKDAEAKDTEVKAPEAGGDAIDLKDSVNAGLPANAPIKFTTAKSSATKNDDGSITYTTEIVVTNPFGKADTVVLRHTPALKEGGDEAGILTFTREPLGDKATAPAGDQNAVGSKYDVMAIQYKKSTDADGVAHMNAELTRASINKTYSPIDDNGLVNFAALPDSAANSDIHAIKYVSFDIEPATGAGDLSYWMNPGGNKAESARGFLFNISAADDGLLSGCGISGATNNVSIRAAALDSSLVLAPVRYWHPRENQNVHPNKDARYTANEGNAITEQCFAQNAAGLYVIDKAKTTSVKGYDVKATSNVRPPERPPEPKLPPPPALPSPKA